MGRFLLVCALLAALAAPAAAEEEAESLQNPQLYLELIHRLQAQRLHYAALSHLDAFDARWPKQPEARLLRADALRETGRPEEALALYADLIDGPQAARAHHGRGLVAARAGQLADALAELRRAARKAPVDSTILGDLGYIALRLGHGQEAREALFRAAELAPADRRIGANLALYFTVAGDASAAEQIVARLALSPDLQAQIREQAARLAAGAPGPEGETP